MATDKCCSILGFIWAPLLRKLPLVEHRSFQCRASGSRTGAEGLYTVLGLRSFLYPEMERLGFWNRGLLLFDDLCSNLPNFWHVVSLSCHKWS